MQLPCNNLRGKITHTVTVTGHTVTPHFINHCGSLDQPTASGRHGIPVDGPGAVVAQSPGLWLNWLGMAGHSGCRATIEPSQDWARLPGSAAGIPSHPRGRWYSSCPALAQWGSLALYGRIRVDGALLWHSDQWPMIELNSRPGPSTWLEVPGIEPQAASEARVMARQGPLVIMR